MRLFITVLSLSLLFLYTTESQAVCQNQYSPIGQVTGSNEPLKFWFHSTDYDAPSIHKVRITCYAGRFTFSETLTTWASRQFTSGQRCEAYALNYNSCGQKAGVDVLFWRMP